MYPSHAIFNGSKHISMFKIISTIKISGGWCYNFNKNSGRGKYWKLPNLLLWFQAISFSLSHVLEKKEKKRKRHKTSMMFLGSHLVWPLILLEKWSRVSVLSLSFSAIGKMFFKSMHSEWDCVLIAVHRNLQGCRFPDDQCILLTLASFV